MTKHSPRRHEVTKESGAGLSPVERQIRMNNLLAALAPLKRLRQTPERAELIRTLTGRLAALEAMDN